MQIMKSPEIQWIYEFDREIQNSPVISENSIYIASWDELFNIDINSVNTIWKYKVKGLIKSCPLVNNSIVYNSSTGPTISAIHAESMEASWVFAAETRESVYTTPLLVNNMLIIGDDDGYLYSFDAVNGKELNKFKVYGKEVEIETYRGTVIKETIIKRSIISSPCMYDSLIFFGSDDRNLYALDIETFEPKWVFTSRDRITSSPCAADGIVYFGSLDGHLYAVDIETGKELWNIDTDDWVHSSPCVVNGIVYFGSLNHCMYAVDAITGKEIWKFKTGGAIASSPVIDNGLVFFGSYDKKLYAVDCITGEESFSFETKGEINCTPVVQDGVVYFGSWDKKFYALKFQ